MTDTVVTDAADNVDKSWSWQYDPAGNRLRESVDTASTYSDYNDLNQLTQRGGSGTTLVEGIVDSPSIVMVNDEQAAMYALSAGDYRFQKTVPVAEGSNTITVEATDASQNVRTNVYNVQIGGVQKTLEYDLNGNLRYERDDQGAILREFQWDARNRLIAIIDGIYRTEFEYDGFDRRIRIVEKEWNSAASSFDLQNASSFLWAGTEIIQKRNANADAVLRNYFKDGFTEGSDSYFYAKDHLGSIREVIASDGQTIESRYEYTPWGVVTRAPGIGVESDFLYTGHFHHGKSDLHLTLYRAYNPELGRWLSRDPLEFNLGFPAEFLPEGPNLYSYVGNNPINYIDEEGHFGVVGAGIGFATGFGVDLGLQAFGNWRDGKKWNCNLDYKSAATSGAFGALAGGTGVGLIGQANKVGNSLKNASRLNRNLRNRARAVEAGKFRNPAKTAQQRANRNESLKDAASAAGKGAVFPLLKEGYNELTEDPEANRNEDCP